MAYTTDAAWHQLDWIMASSFFVGATVIMILFVLGGIKMRQNILKALSGQAGRASLEGTKWKQEASPSQTSDKVLHFDEEIVGSTVQKDDKVATKRGDLLSDILADLEVVHGLVENDEAGQKVRDLIRKIELNLHQDQMAQADHLNENHEFFDELKKLLPDLTSKELQLCALVRMNLSNKEIASRLNISVRGVETARYRLRKRLNNSGFQFSDFKFPLSKM